MFAQDNAVHGRWQVGLHVSPDIAHTHWRDAPVYNPYGWNVRTYPPLFGFTAGGNVFYAWRSYLGFEAGIQFGYRGYGEKKDFSAFPAPINVGYKYWHDAHRYAYLELPLKVVFKSKGERVRFVGSVGASAGLLMYRRTYSKRVRLNGLKEMQSYPVHSSNSKFDVIPFASAGIELKLSERLNLRIEPVFRYSLRKQRITEYDFVHFWSAGVDFGCYFRL